MDGSRFRARLGFMPQYPGMYPNFGVEEFLWYVATLKDMGAGFRGKEKKAYGDFLADKDELQKIFAALAGYDTMNAIVYLYHKTENYVFESTVLARDCGIPSDKIDSVLNDLLLLKLIWKNEVNINGEPRILYYSRPSHKLLALFIMAREIGYKGAYTLQTHLRTTPFIK